MTTIIEVELADEAIAHHETLDRIFGEPDFEDFETVEFEYNLFKAKSSRSFDQDEISYLLAVLEDDLIDADIDYREVRSEEL
jgi:hypothetical protein